VDLHKYAYAPKGVSVLLHRSAELRAPQYFAWADWPGYPMVNPVIASTRSGGPIAAAYATLRHLGDDGYLALASSTWDAVCGLASAVSTVDGLALVVEPRSTVVAFRSTDPELDLFVLGDELAARGWHVQTQFAHGGIPASIHLSVTASVAPRVDEFAAALAEAADAARAAGPAAVPPLDLSELTPELVAQLAGSLGLFGGGDRPVRMAPVNAILAAAPPKVREWLLVEFLSLLQSSVL
jgi:sphinganine-1-phosphate aldolase